MLLEENIKLIKNTANLFLKMEKLEMIEKPMVLNHSNQALFISDFFENPKIRKFLDKNLDKN